MSSSLKRLAGKAVDLVLVGVVVALAIRFFLADGIVSQARGPDIESIPIAEWRSLQAAAASGDTLAAVQVIAFVDYQCEACRHVHRVLDSLERANPLHLSVGVIPFPLRRHPFAVAAANVAQCANEQGRFDEFETVVYRAQEQIGAMPMESLAVRSGIVDVVSFRTCVSSADTLPAVRRGIELASRIGLRGTPSVVVNGRLLKTIPTTVALSEHIMELVRTPAPR